VLVDGRLVEDEVNELVLDMVMFNISGDEDL
jgi:hypothetical protein